MQLRAPDVAPARHSPRSVYRHEDGATLVEIRLREVRQMFHTLDPAPFHEKDLDEAAERYLVDACREVGMRNPVRIVIHLPPGEAESADARALPDAVHHYFDYRQRQLRIDLLQLLRYGAVSLVIGLAFLGGCLLLRRALLARTPAFDPSILREGLLILGWVAMWRPIEVFLYDWWPLVRRRGLLQRLAALPIEIRARASRSSTEDSRATRG
jgi:hypothetical protein